MANEQFKKLCEQVSSLGYGTPEVIAGMYTAIEIMGAGEFEALNTEPVKFSGDKLHFTLSFGGNGSYPALQSVAVNLFREQPIRHAVIQGVDTAALYEQMRHINWSIDFFDREKTESKVKRDPALLMMANKAFDAYTVVKRLLASGESEGIGIGIQLMRKFWQDGNFGRSVGFQNAIALLNPPVRHRFELHTIPLTMTECYHMLCGRPVCKETYMVPGGVQTVWHQLDLHQQRGDMNYHMRTFPDFDLNPVLDRLPFDGVKGDRRISAIAKLRMGEELEVMAPGGGKLLLSVDAAGQSVTIFDETREIISLETFLRVEQHKKRQAEQTNARTRTKNRKGKKGRGKKE